MPAAAAATAAAVAAAAAAAAAVVVAAAAAAMRRDAQLYLHTKNTYIISEKRKTFLTPMLAAT